MRRWLMILALLCLWMSWAITPAAAQDNGCAEPLDLYPGQYIYTRPGVFLRNLPSINGGRIDFYNTSVTFEIVDGPVCADGYNWWHVDEGPVEGFPGWIAEGTPDFYLIFPGDNPNPPPPCAPMVAGLAEGVNARLLSDLRVRRQPGFTTAVYVVLPGNSYVLLAGGATCVEDVNWWPITFTDTNGALIEGYIAESQDGTPLLAFDDPTAPQCGPSYRRLESGIRAVITYSDFKPKNLRAEPSTSATIIVELLDGVAVDLVNGPVCADGYNWWQVTVAGQPEVTGWVAEGGAGNIWLRPLIYE